MRAGLLLSCALLVLALANCGDDKSGSGGDGKQSKISAEAYPAVNEFITTDAEFGQYKPICDKLAAVAEDDALAPAPENASREPDKTAADFKPFKSEGAACNGDGDCLADKAEPRVTQFLKGLRELGTSFNREIKDALEPGECLDTLTLPESDLKAIDTALDRLPDAMKRLRAGDRSGLENIFDVDFSGERDPKPCKP